MLTHSKLNIYSTEIMLQLFSYIQFGIFSEFMLEFYLTKSRHYGLWIVWRTPTEFTSWDIWSCNMGESKVSKVRGPVVNIVSIKQTKKIV